MFYIVNHEYDFTHFHVLRKLYLWESIFEFV